MELGLQARLLRVLEDGRVRRLGSTTERRVDVRLIAATHEDLEDAVARKTFRQDLYYRLAHLPIDVPPLRERGKDIEILFRHFLATYCGRSHRRLPGVEDDVIEQLGRWPWPGNVRELKNLAERLSILAADPINIEQLPEPYRSGRPVEVFPGTVEAGADLTLREFRASCERQYIEKILEETAGNVSEAARRLGIHRSRLHEKLKRLGIRRS